MLDMSNITDDKTEDLLVFVRRIAQFTLYGDEMPYEAHHGEDAMETLNRCIEDARKLLES